ncbi:DUF4087 domain-containing protein [Leptospira alstonii]|uniref:DUF4087 domain-containing protein n=1 Tax=Leptospira alstonii TaxID=28452 RepID=UPI001F43CFC2|nr:DUF4087 domain-containing protein [Leptospira alstonii]
MKNKEIDFFTTDKHLQTKAQKLRQSANHYFKSMNTRLTILVVLLFVMTVIAPANLVGENKTVNFETRCGWLSNPTPANISLYDRDAEWKIGVQGGYQVAGDWQWPTFQSGQWVQTNSGSYGYGCACLRLRASKQTHEVLEIKTARGILLKQCRQDPALKRWKQMFK